VFQQLLDTNKIEKAPVIEVIKNQPKEIILSALLRMSEQAPFYVFTAFIFAYAVGTLHMSRNFILVAVMSAACVSFFTIPLSGHISDLIGRKKMYLIGVVTMGLFGFLYFGMVDTAIPSAVFIAIVLSLIPHDMQYGPQAALIAESFTPRLRYSGASLGYQLASIIAGGPAPLIATALFATYHSGYAVAIYIAVCAVISLVSAALMPDYTGSDISMEYEEYDRGGWVSAKVDMSTIASGRDIVILPNDGPPTPSPASIEYDPRSVGLFFATTREEAPLFSEGWFTGERAKTTSLGTAFVRIPENHRIGKIELPMKIKLLSVTLYEQTRDPRKHFVIRSVEIVREKTWGDMIQSLPTNEILVFVHGFNTSFEQGLYRTAQIVWDLQFRGVPVLFSWPSRGHVADYGYDRESALGARQAFINLLKLLKAQHNIKKIHILVHSMGNLVVLDGLASFQHDVASLNLGELMLAAPDVDRDHFTSIASIVRKVTSGVTLYASSADKALMLSKKIAGQIPRAGDVPAGGPILVPNIDSIDVTAIGDEMLGLNHSVFAQTRSILNDVGLLIRTSQRPPHERLSEIRRVPEGANPPKYWRYTP
jgi:esterase/lipase superfamily enzyme